MFDLKQFLINEGMTRVSRDHKKRNLQEMAKVLGKGNGETLSGREVYDALPDILYHILPEKSWEKVEQAGYLGYNYNVPEKYQKVPGSAWLSRSPEEEDEPRGNFLRRTWQKAGWGIFLGTSPQACFTWSGIAHETRPEDLVILKVNKGSLDPEMFYFDGDILSYSMGIDDTDQVSPDNLSVFYAKQIPLNKLTVIRKGDTDLANYSKISEQAKVWGRKKISELENILRSAGTNPELEGGIVTLFEFDLVFFKVFNTKGVDYVGRYLAVGGADGFSDFIVILGSSEKDAKAFAQKRGVEIL